MDWDVFDHMITKGEFENSTKGIMFIDSICHLEDPRGVNIGESLLFTLIDRLVAIPNLEYLATIIVTADAAANPAPLIGTTAGGLTALIRFVFSTVLKVMLALTVNVAVAAALPADTVTVCAPFGVKVVTVKADVSQEEQVINMVKMAIEKFGSLEILVNNAGTASISPTVDMSLEEWQKSYRKKATKCSKQGLGSKRLKKTESE
jgi:hypothetical protein